MLFSTEKGVTNDGTIVHCQEGEKGNGKEMREQLFTKRGNGKEMREGRERRETAIQEKGCKNLDLKWLGRDLERFAVAFTRSDSPHPQPLARLPPSPLRGEG
jgi:hypothetical protein